jgi:hypothetical protein
MDSFTPTFHIIRSPLSILGLPEPDGLLVSPEIEDAASYEAADVVAAALAVEDAAE